MKRKWYLQTWLICLLFAFWFAYGIPLILGIGLLILKLREEKSLFSQNKQLNLEVNDMRQLLTPEMQDAHALQKLISNLHKEEETANVALENIKIETEKSIQKKEKELDNLDKTMMWYKKS